MIATLFICLTLILISGFYSVSKKGIQSITFFFSMFCFFLSILYLILFDRSNASYQFISTAILGSDLIPFFKHSFIFGIDGISLFFILLSAYLIPLCLLIGWKKDFKLVSDYCFYFILLEVFLILSFSALDIITFFIFFESVLIPMFFIIGI